MFKKLVTEVVKTERLISFTGKELMEFLRTKHPDLLPEDIEAIETDEYSFLDYDGRDVRTMREIPFRLDMQFAIKWDSEKTIGLANDES